MDTAVPTPGPGSAQIAAWLSVVLGGAGCAALLLALDLRSPAVGIAGWVLSALGLLVGAVAVVLTFLRARDHLDVSLLALGLGGMPAA